MAEEQGKKKQGALGSLVQAESMLQIGLAVPAGCLIGWGLGDLAAKHFHKDWMLVTGVLLGAAGGFVQLIRGAAGYMKKGS